MPSQLHEALLLLFRNRPALAPELLREALHRELPPYTEVRIAAVAQEASIGLDEDRSRLYFDLVLASLSEAARQELQAMDPAKYEYQSEFARRYVAQGRLEGKAEGKAEGRAELVIRQLTLRFGPLGDDVRAWISAASIEALDAIGERLLTAQSLQDALGPH